MVLEAKTKKQIEAAEQRIHKLEEENPEKVEKIRKNLKAMGFSGDDVMKVVPRLPDETIDTLSMFKPRYMEEFDPGDFGIDKVLEKAEKETK